MRGAARLATYLGRIMIAVGLVVMYLGWNFAAGLDYAQGQLPFILSASIPGLALVVIGMSLEFVQTVRELTARRAREAAQIDAALSRLLGFVRDGGDFGPAAPVVSQGVGNVDLETTLPPGDQAFAPLHPESATSDGPVAPAQAPAAGTAASSAAPAPVAAASAPDAPSPVVEVIAGRSSYHDPSCRLVSNRDDMQAMARSDAAARGLAPCRVCKP